MENKSKLKFEEVKKMILSLNEAIDIVSKNTDITHEKWLKDSVIQRFEYTIEWIWKFLKTYLLEIHWQDLISPKQIIKGAYKVWIIKDMKIFIDMIEIRNRLSHDYHEEFAEITFEQIIDNYIEPINNLLNFMKKEYE